MEEQPKKKSWFKRHPFLTVFIVAFIIVGGFSYFGAPTGVSTPSNTAPATSVTNQQSNLIKAPDTKNILFVLNNTKIIEGDCSEAKSFEEYGTSLSKDCEKMFSTDISNYCERGNKKGENVNYYYCRPMRVIKCSIVSSSGEIEDIKYYGTTKILKCDTSKEQLMDIQIKICTPNVLGFECSQ